LKERSEARRSAETLTIEEAELRNDIRKNALLNAVRHEGKAQEGAVTGKILGEKPELRTKIKMLSELIRDVVQEINSLSREEQRQIVEQKWPELLFKEKREEEKSLPPLPNAENYDQVITRFSPNPDCATHLGNARAIILCYEYARLYEGKFILRFDDTDPKIKKPVLEFYDAIRRDLNWLGCKPDEEYIQSDRIPIYYEHAEKLLTDGNAYVCTCEPKLFKEKTLAGQPCACRGLSADENLARWRRMLKGEYAEGEAVVRVKTDLNHPNPAARDWPALRIIDTDKFPHPRVGKKYLVWPLYNLASGVDDHLLSITHIIRGKEHLTNQVRQEYMYRYMGWKYPEAIHYGRLKITGAFLSKSKIVQGIKEGLFKGWDDPRLATFSALRRRGITPQAIRKMIIDVGPKTQDVVLSWENLYAYNRKILDPIAERYFFVDDPIELTVENIPRVFDVKLHRHPDHREGKTRDYTIRPEQDNRKARFWVSRKDVNSSTIGNVFRLMELFNVEIERANTYSANASFSGESYEHARRMKTQLIHWIPVGQDVPCKVVMQDATIVEGIAESYCRELEPNVIIQFERYGFVRLDKVGEELIAYYAHK
jgi:glutamyl-tRNA synthetase